MNQFFKHKILSFTLAEMMVVLALFSVISAATMPVITARQKMEGTASSTSGGVAGDYEDPWEVNFYSLKYSAGESNNTAAVMVGSDVNDSAQSLGYPTLIVTDKVGISNGSRDPSQIKLFKDVDGTTYDCGRIMMGNDYMRSIGTVAIGANALAYNSNNFRSYNVAIGSNALNDRNAKADRYFNVAIGYNALSATRNSSSNNVGIGTEVGYKNKVNNSVLIGNMAGYTSNDGDSIENSVVMGSHAGLNRSMQNSVVVGKYAGYNENNNPNNTVLIGYYAGYVGGQDGQASAPDNFIAIGSYAFANNEYEPELGDAGIAIGYYAGNFGNFSSINIGSYAGYYNYEGDYSVNIGQSAGSELSNSSYQSIYLGYNAGMYAGGDNRICIGTNSCTNSSYNNEANVSIGHYAGAHSPNSDVYASAPKSVMLGYYAGSDATLTRSVCIGSYACSGSNNYDGLVRISPKDGYWERSGNDTISVIGDVPDSIRNASMNYGYDSLVITPLYGSLRPAKAASSDNDSSIILFGDVFGPSNYLQAFSDKRLKEHIRPTKYGLKEIRKINVYNYNWKTCDTKTPQIGVIAQEVQKIIPESVHVDKDNKIGGYLTVNSTWFLYPMVNAIKELDSQVMTIQKKLVAYSKEYVSLIQRVNKLEKDVKVLEKENKTLTRDVKVAYTKVKKAERR